MKKPKEPEIDNIHIPQTIRNPETGELEGIEPVGQDPSPVPKEDNDKEVKKDHAE